MARNDWDQRKVWVQRDGTPIRIKKMGDEHLRNTLRILKQNAASIHDAYVLRTFVFTVGPSGDMATDLFDREFDEALEADPWTWLKSRPLVQALLKEYGKRAVAEFDCAS